MKVLLPGTEAERLESPSHLRARKIVKRAAPIWGRRFPTCGAPSGALLQRGDAVEIHPIGGRLAAQEHYRCSAAVRRLDVDGRTWRRPSRRPPVDLPVQQDETQHTSATHRERHIELWQTGGAPALESIGIVSIRFRVRGGGRIVIRQPRWTAPVLVIAVTGAVATAACGPIKLGGTPDAGMAESVRAFCQKVVTCGTGSTLDSCIAGTATDTDPLSGNSLPACLDALNKYAFRMACVSRLPCANLSTGCKTETNTYFDAQAACLLQEDEVGTDAGTGPGCIPGVVWGEPGTCRAAHTRCDATTRTCEVPPPCSTNADCTDGFTCDVSDKECIRHCASVIGQSDDLCQPPRKCQHNFTCK